MSGRDNRERYSVLTVEEEAGSDDAWVGEVIREVEEVVVVVPEKTEEEEIAEEEEEEERKF